VEIRLAYCDFAFLSYPRYSCSDILGSCSDHALDWTMTLEIRTINLKPRSNSTRQRYATARVDDDHLSGRSGREHGYRFLREFAFSSPLPLPRFVDKVIRLSVSRNKVGCGAQELILSSHDPPPAARPNLGDPVQHLPQINGNLCTHSGERREIYVLLQQRDEQRQSQGRQVSASMSSRSYQNRR
jgi:hypothetical protein